MDFSKLRHRIIFLRPTDTVTNSMGETVPRYRPFKPYLPLPLQVQGEDVYLKYDSDGNAVFVYADGKPYAHKLALKEYSVAGFVSPMSGREYEESQKLRAETTYKISTRFFRNITPEMRILYDSREFEIVSVLDLNERHEELQIIAIERDRHSSQDFKGENNE
jgi:SPP1 family predicted phage head-tail adaptor